MRGVHVCSGGCCLATRAAGVERCASCTHACAAPAREPGRTRRPRTCVSWACSVLTSCCLAAASCWFSATESAMADFRCDSSATLVWTVASAWGGGRTRQRWFTLRVRLRAGLAVWAWVGERGPSDTGALTAGCRCSQPRQGPESSDHRHPLATSVLPSGRVCVVHQQTARPWGMPLTLDRADVVGGSKRHKHGGDQHPSCEPSCCVLSQQTQPVPFWKPAGTHQPPSAPCLVPASAAVASEHHDPVITSASCVEVDRSQRQKL